MRRRTLLALAGGAALTWPFAARAQPQNRKRLIGVLMNFRADEPEGRLRITAFVQALQQFGWTDGANMHLEIRWAGDDAARYARHAEELVAQAPDVILASASPSVAALQQATHNVPIVFANVIDPVGAGYVASLARPGGNITGFTAFDYSIAGKWFDLLKQIAPRMRRLAVVRDPSFAAGIGLFAVIQSVASSSGVEISVIDPRETGELDRGFGAFAHEPDGGVIVTAAASIIVRRELIVSLATRHRLPSIYPFAYYAVNGGLASYGPSSTDEFTRAAAYADRIIKGESPRNLPVQAPTKYELAINLRSARAFGLAIPPALLATADQVIE